MPVFKIHHITKYEYNRPVRESVNEIKIFPTSGDGQEILLHQLSISTEPDVYFFYDYWGNKTGAFNVLGLHQTLIIESKLVIRNSAISNPAINFNTDFATLEKEISDRLKLVEFTDKDPLKNQEVVDRIAQEIKGDGKSITAVAERCAAYIYRNFRYKKGITSIETTVDEILEHKSGVCQDFAHLMLQVLATLKIPSRYVSGYVCPNKSGMRGEGATHAWVEVYIPAYGWAGIDPTNNVWVTDGHIKLATGRHFSDCTPVKGTFKGPAHQKLSVYVSIGYEDGHVFEEVNNVQMEALPSDKKEALTEEIFAGQQQQQQ